LFFFQNILIDLQVIRDGYIIKGCRFVNDKEYAEFEQKLKRWKKLL